MFGVRNGIDMDVWDPSMDPYLPVPYDISNFDEGKVRADCRCCCCNGVGVDVWNPSMDPYLPVPCDISNFDEGKVRNRF